MISFSSIASKVHAGDRISDDDALFMFRSDELLEIGKLASHANDRKNGSTVLFNVNRHINYTNICKNHCRFCAFRRDPEEPGAYVMDIEEIRALAEESLRRGASEIHMVGGLHPDLKLDYYFDILSLVKSLSSDLHLKAFTVVEIDHLSRISGLPVREVLEKLRQAGLDSIPGGGAEIFAEDVRKTLCSDKISGSRWLEIMEEAHRAGLRSNATMLYGHLESYEDRVDHMSRLRELQDRTGGFQAFVPLPFQPGNTSIVDDASMAKGGVDDLKTMAIARLYLDNFAHLKAYWVLLGEKIAQVALMFGADDLDGTVVEEKIGHEASADSPLGLGREEIVRLIRQAGRNPVERDSLYNAQQEDRI